MLQLNPITINEEYRKKWNISCTDFVHLCNEKGEKINDTLYRTGFVKPNLKAEYFVLIKHVEAFYSKDILRMSKSTDPKHLESQWVIVDKNGVERVNFKQFENPYITGGVVYNLDRKYYNIETGELYCDTSTSMSTKDFIFLENRFDKDESKRGVMKINKKDGTYELFPE